MDDWVILAPTRWKLRRAVRDVNRVLDELRVEQHPDKTFVGKVVDRPTVPGTSSVGNLFRLNGWIASRLFLFQSRRDDPKPAQSGAT